MSRPRKGPTGHRDGLDAGKLLGAQRLPKAVQACLASSLGDEQHPRTGEIVGDGEVAVRLAEALLVNAQVCNRLGATACESTSHSTFEDAVNCVPAQGEQFGYALLARFLEPRNRETFGAVATRRSGVQNRLVLTSVEMMPKAFGLMIVERLLHPTLGTTPQHLLVGRGLRRRLGAAPRVRLSRGS